MIHDALFSWFGMNNLLFVPKIQAIDKFWKTNREDSIANDMVIRRECQRTIYPVFYIKG